MMLHEIVETKRADRALYGLVAGNINPSDKWIFQQ
jgi:hypothetical protein